MQIVWVKRLFLSNQQKVSEKSSKEIEAYRIARAKSLASATRRVLI